MKNIITPGYIGNFIVNLFIFVLLACVYTYIQKLETTGNCDCALDYPYLKFIKSFSLFAFVFLLFVMLVPPGTVLADLFGSQITGLYVFVLFVFYIVFAVFLFMTMTYTRLLITEKCKCSEDIRREFIYAGSTIEILLLAMFVLIAIVFPLLLSSLSILFKNMKSVSSTIEENLKNPVKGITKLPSQVAEVGKQVKEVVSTTAKGVKSLTKK